MELRSLKQRPVELRPLLRDLFHRGPWTIRFRRDAAGNLTGLSINDTGRIPGSKFRREP